MHLRAAFFLLLSYSTPLILTQDQNADEPVDVLSLKHIQINNYNGPIDEETVALFKNVEILEIRESNFTPLHDSVLHGLPNLKKLSLSNCDIVREVHDVSSCCKKLQEIEFTNSGLLSLPWNQIGDDWPVERIFLSHEKSPKLEANILVDKKLKHFTLQYSDVETIDDGAFNGLSHLESLSLEGNKIKKITKAMLAPLKNLKVLNLSKNLLEELTADQIPNLPDLEKLDIGNNPIKKLDIVGIKKLLPKLTTLDVSGIDNIGSPKLEDLGNLTLVKHSVL